MSQPARGEVWFTDLDPTRGREQAGRRPVVVISSDNFNQGPAELVVVAPITSKGKGIPLHVPFDPPEGGVKVRSYILCEAIRSVSKERLFQRWGSVSPETLLSIETNLRRLLEL